MSSNIFSKNPSVFTDVPGNKECVITNTNIKSGLPKRVIILRHCDQGYKPSCVHDPKKTTCPGCEFGASECQTNLCNETGVKRSWQYGNWLACYAKTNQIQIVSIFSQIFKGGLSNQRPQTTASIAYANLLQQKNTNEWISKNLCYNTFNKGDYHNIKLAVGDNAFKNGIVVIIWDHGEISPMTVNLGGKTKGINWDNCCFDQAIVIEGDNKNKVNLYNMNSFPNDPCSSICKTSTQYSQCAGAIYGNNNQPINPVVKPINPVVKPINPVVKPINPVVKPINPSPSKQPYSIQPTTRFLYLLFLLPIIILLIWFFILKRK
jgi:hypothetical protein